MKKNSLVLFYADAHLRDSGSFYPYNRLAENGLTPELNNIIQGFRFVADQINKLHPILVVFLGDLFHLTEFVNTKVLHAVDNALGLVAEAVEDIGAEHYILAGNHDFLNESKKISSITPLGAYGKILLEPSVVSVGGHKIGLVPAYSSLEIVAAQMMTLIDQHKVELIGTHADFEGGVYDNGELSHSSLSASWPVPVISGDLHSFQSVGAVEYVGSLVQHRFNHEDLSLVGGVLVYDLKEKKIKRFPNTYSKHYVRIRDLDRVKQFKPEQVVLQVISSEPKEVIDEKLAGYDFYHLPEPINTENPKTVYVDAGLEDPKKILRSYIDRHNPGALSVFDEVLL